MPAPTVTSAEVTLSGSTLTLAVLHSNPDESVAVAGTVTNAAGQSATFSDTAVFPGPGAAITDGGGKTWTLLDRTTSRTRWTAAL